MQPAEETYSGGCYTPILGAIGYYVNGVSIFGSSDGNSYNNQKVWYNSAPEFELYDMDPCNGHAANGEYHHHHYPKCLQEVLNDNGDKHSPIYGWLLDGFPIYGPFQSDGVLAQSCWLRRDYSSSSPTGCSDNQRSCQLKNQYDYTQGTKSVSSGPSLTGTILSLSSNSIDTVSGVYFEDYYYNQTCFEQGDEYLNEFNGHDHDSLGFHYHITINNLIEKRATFPYLSGPKYYGCRSSGICCKSRTSGTCSPSTSVCGTTEGTSSYQCDSDSVTNFPTLSPTRSAAPTISMYPTITLSPTPQHISTSSSNNNNYGLIIGVVVGVAGGIILMIIVYFTIKSCTKSPTKVYLDDS